MNPGAFNAVGIIPFAAHLLKVALFMRKICAASADPIRSACFMCVKIVKCVNIVKHLELGVSHYLSILRNLAQ